VGTRLEDSAGGVSAILQRQGQTVARIGLDGTDEDLGLGTIDQLGRYRRVPSQDGCMDPVDSIDHAESALVYEHGRERRRGELRQSGHVLLLDTAEARRTGQFEPSDG
jgi:hypothetical protein